jgi:hypothetical protein
VDLVVLVDHLLDLLVPMVLLVHLLVLMDLLVLVDLLDPVDLFRLDLLDPVVH